MCREQSGKESFRAFSAEECDRFDTPILIFTKEEPLYYANDAFCRAFPSFLRDPGGCADRLTMIAEAARYRPAVVDFSKDGGCPALALPFRVPGTQAVQLIFAPFLCGNYSFLKPRSLIGSAGVSFAGLSLRDAALFVRPFEALLREEAGEPTGGFRFMDLCLFLNRYSDRVLAGRGFEVFSKCTADSLNLPLRHFGELCAVFTGLSVLCALCAENRRVELVLTCRAERPLFILSFESMIAAEARGFSALFPSRTPEAEIIGSVLRVLGWTERIDRCGKTVQIEFSCRERLPTEMFKNPIGEELYFRLCAVESLLSLCGARLPDAERT